MTERPDTAAAVLALYQAFLARDAQSAIDVIDGMRECGIDGLDLLDRLWAPALSMLGGAWASGRVDEYEFTRAAVIAEQVSSFVIAPTAGTDRGVAVVVGTIKGDTHTASKNIAAAALKQAGYRVIDLGERVRPSAFLDRAEETGANIVMVSAETERAAERVGRVREHFVAAGRSVVIFVAGGPFVANEARARAVGANGVVSGAASAVALVDAAVERLEVRS